MTETRKKVLNVAEAKRRFSELLNKVVYHGARFGIARRGRIVAGLVPAAEMGSSPSSTPKVGFLSLVGLWQDVGEIDQLIGEIYRQREQEMRRSIPDLSRG